MKRFILLFVTWIKRTKNREKLGEEEKFREKMCLDMCSPTRKEKNPTYTHHSLHVSVLLYTCILNTRYKINLNRAKKGTKTIHKITKYIHGHLVSV